MADLDAYHAMVDSDLTLDKTQLDNESTRTPQIYNKYLKFYTIEKLELRRLEAMYREKKRERREYYLGQASAEVYKAKPFNLKVMRGDVDTYLESDQELSILKSKIDYRETIVEFLQNTLSSISARQWTIRNAIEFMKFLNGGQA